MDEQQAIEEAVSAAHDFIGSYGYGGDVFTAALELMAALEGMALIHEQRLCRCGHKYRVHLDKGAACMLCKECTEFEEAV